MSRWRVAAEATGGLDEVEDDEALFSRLKRDVAAVFFGGPEGWFPKAEELLPPL